MKITIRLESIVAGDAITRCGRRMADEPTKTGGRLVVAADTSVSCRMCDGR